MGINVEVTPRKDEDPIRVIKRFIKKCKKLGILDEFKDKQRYQKPSVKKRLARKRSIARQKKELRKQRRRQN